MPIQRTSSNITGGIAENNIATQKKQNMSIPTTQWHGNYEHTWRGAAAVSISAHHSCAPNWPLQAGRSFLYSFWAHLYARLKFIRGGLLHPWWAMAAWPLKTSGTSWNLKDKLVTMDYIGLLWHILLYLAVELVATLLNFWLLPGKEHLLHPITWYVKEALWLQSPIR